MRPYRPPSERRSAWTSRSGRRPTWRPRSSSDHAGSSTSSREGSVACSRPGACTTRPRRPACRSGAAACSRRGSVARRTLRSPRCPTSSCRATRARPLATSPMTSRSRSCLHPTAPWRCRRDPGSGSTPARTGLRPAHCVASSSCARRCASIYGPTSRAYASAVRRRYHPRATMSDPPPPEEPSPSLPPQPDGGRPGEGEPAAPDRMQPLEAASGGGVTSRPRSKAVTIAMLVVAAVLVVGVVGAGAAYLSLRGASEMVLNKIPTGADAVVVAHLDPAASQKMNLLRMASKFPDVGTEQELTQKLDGMLDDALSGSGLTHEDLGWVGGEIGGYITINGAAPSYAVLVASDDDGAASAALQTFRDGSGATYTQSAVDGVSVWSPTSTDAPAMAIVDRTVVLASDQDAMRAVIQTDHGASSIEEDQTFQGVMDELPDANLGFAYVNVHALTSLAALVPGRMGGLETQFAAYEGAAYSISAESDGLEIDGAVTTDPSKLTDAQREALGSAPNPLLSITPANAYAVLASSGMGQTLEDSVTQYAQLGPGPARMIERLGLTGRNGVLQHLTGDLGVQVGPGSGLLPVSGTVMIGVDDAGAVQSWLDDHVPGVVAQAGLSELTPRTLKTEEYQGVKITYGALPTTPVAWGVVNGALVVGLSPHAVEQAVDLSQGGGSSITSNADFSSVVDGLSGPGTDRSAGCPAPQRGCPRRPRTTAS